MDQDAAPHRRLWVWLRALVGVALLAVLLSQLDWPALLAALGDIRWGLLAAATVSFLATVPLEVARLRVVLGRLGLPWWQPTRLHVVGLLYGSVVPGSFGGDLYKVVALRARGDGTVGPLVLVLLVRLVGVAVLAGAAVVSLLLRGGFLVSRLSLTGLQRLGAQLPVLLLALVVVLLGLAVVPGLRGRVRAVVARSLAEGSAVLRAVTVGQVAALLGLSLLLLLARVQVIWFLVGAVGKHVTMLDATLVFSVAAVIVLVPISLAGLGVREGTVVALLSCFGVPYEAAVLVAVIGRALWLLLVIWGGLWLAGEAMAAGRGTGDTPQVDAGTSTSSMASDDG